MTKDLKKAALFLQFHTTEEQRDSFTLYDTHLMEVIAAQVEMQPFKDLSKAIHAVVSKTDQPGLQGDVNHHITLYDFKNKKHFCDCLAALFIIKLN